MSPSASVSTAPSGSLRRDRRYWLRLARLLIFGLFAALVLLPFGIGALMMWALTHPPCGRYGSPDDYGLAYEDVSFGAPQGYTLRGYFLPGANGATVIIAPTLGNDRSGDLPDAAILNRAGFNVLTFDARICAGAPSHSLGYLEAEDVAAAYAYLQTRSDVDPARVSLHGFSSAGSTSLFAAARIPQIRAVSVKGSYHDFAEQLGLGQDGSPFIFLIRAGADVAYRLITGQDVRVLVPLDTLDDIAPRPVFLIYGSREVSLPGARLMLDRANGSGGSADLWIVEGAGHGNYLAVAGDEYERRLVEFHRAALGVPSD